MRSTVSRGVLLALALALPARAAGTGELVLATDEPPPPPAPAARAELELAASPPCDDRRPFRRCPGGTVRLDVINVFGLRGSLTRVEEHEAVAGAQLGGVGVAYDTRGAATIRLAHLAFIGGGTGGVEGGIGIAYAMGALGALGRGHGPFARLGGRAFLLGNDELYSSHVELPELQLGYQLLRHRLHLELAGRAGAVLIGRYNPDDARRPLGKAFEWGGLASLRVDAVHLDLEWMRIEARASAPDTPVDVLSGMLCGAAFPIGVCLDLRRYSGAARARSPAGGVVDLDSTYLGVSIGGANDF